MQLLAVDYELRNKAHPLERNQAPGSCYCIQMAAVVDLGN